MSTQIVTPTYDRLINISSSTSISFPTFGLKFMILWIQCKGGADLRVE